jgi:hypothetical protein
VLKVLWFNEDLSNSVPWLIVEFQIKWPLTLEDLDETDTGWLMYLFSSFHPFKLWVYGLHSSCTLRLWLSHSKTKADCTLLSIYILASCFFLEFHHFRDVRGYQIQNSTEACLSSSRIAWTNKYCPYNYQWASWNTMQDKKRGVMMSSTCSVSVVWGHMCIHWTLHWICLRTDNYPSLFP